MKHCTECGAKNTNSAKICSDCGSEIKKYSEKKDSKLLDWGDDSHPIKLTTMVESDPMKELNNLVHLKYLETINDHLWWLALMAKIALVMILLQFFFVFLLLDDL
jgi:ribosomal protein L40E